MPIYLMELHEGLLDLRAPAGPAPKTEGWRFYARCDDDERDTCGFLYRDPGDFRSQATRKQFLQLLANLFGRAPYVISWQQAFADGRRFHPIHEFEVQRERGGRVRAQTVEVLQFKNARGLGVRLLSIQEGIGWRNVLFLSAFEKTTKRTPPEEQARAETLARAFFRALDRGELRMISAQGGEDATPRFTAEGRDR